MDKISGNSKEKKNSKEIFNHQLRETTIRKKYKKQIAIYSLLNHLKNAQKIMFFLKSFLNN